MFSRPKILFLVSLLFVALLNPKFNPYLLFKFLIFYHSSNIQQLLYHMDKPIDVISVHDQADILSSIKYLVESTVVHINHHHLNDATLHHHKSVS